MKHVDTHEPEEHVAQDLLAGKIEHRLSLPDVRETPPENVLRLQQC